MSTSKELTQVPVEGKPGIDQNISLKEVIGQALKPYLVTGRNNDIIVRCGDLPVISGDLLMVQQACNDLVRMIMLHPRSSKKFLHITCGEQLPATGHQNKFRVEFHTNLTTDSNWKQLNKETILSCEEKLLSSGAYLTVHEISTTGCLFSISLQGKIF